MGPFRRRLSLTLLISVMASPALAEVCYKERPDWDGIPVTLESEALALFLSPRRTVPSGCARSRRALPSRHGYSHCRAALVVLHLIHCLA